MADVKSKKRPIRLTLPEEEIMSPGHLACQGCGAAMAMRYALKALGPNTIASIPACCWAVIDGPFPYSAAGIPIYHCAFETAASTAGGISYALKALKKKDEKSIKKFLDSGYLKITLTKIQILNTLMKD